MKQPSTQVAPYKAGASKTPAGATAQASSASFGISDIAYIFYRHKKKIIACSVLGIIAAGGIGLKYKTDYSSDSKLMIRYVVDSRRGNPTDANDQIRNPDSRGDNIINSEVELITSLDLAVQVAEEIGATNILSGLPNVNPKSMTADQQKLAAAVAIRNRLEIRVKPKSNVIGVSFQHPEAAIARSVLEKLIGVERQVEGGPEYVPGAYVKAHARVHRDLGLLKDLSKQKSDKSLALVRAEGALKKLKQDSKVVSVQESKRAFAESLARLRSQKNEAEQMLSEAKASFQQITNSLALAKADAATQAPAPAPTAAVDKTNATPAIAVPAIPIPTPEIAAEFQGLNRRLEFLRQREQLLLLQFVPSSIFVKPVSDQIAVLNSERQQLIDAHPGLTNSPAAATPANPLLDRQQTGIVQTTPTPQLQPRNQIDLVAEAAKIQALEARFTTVSRQLESEEKLASTFGENEPKILQLERDIQSLEKQIASLQSAEDEAGITDALIASKASNISVLQYPTPAYPATGALLKLLGGAIFGGIGLGVGIALLIEFVSDRSVRRAKHVVDNLNVPLFLSVPRLDLPQGGAGAAPGGAPAAPAGGGSEDAEELARFAEALRDRLIMHFQIKEVTHKPKLIGVTSCGRGAGVTTLATSLAASLSETGEGNVLYVDVNSQMKASAAPFRKGKPVVGITEALGETGRDAAQVGENLYMVSLGDPATNKVGVIPKKLANLVPKIRESNYDYIIFDLPPVTQTSVAARVSGLLDTTVMVLESEKTQSELARQAVKLLGESNTELVAVLNKHKKYLPESLETDL